MIKASPKDFFLHLLSAILLYVSVGSFINLVFNIISIYFPDILDSNYYADLGAKDSIRFAISALVVLFPCYLGSVYILNRVYLNEPEKRSLKIRKWLIYFTLFVAALIIMGDLVYTINTFLKGEITARFILKATTLLFVIGSVFGYYFWDLKRYGENEK